MMSIKNLKSSFEDSSNIVHNIADTVDNFFKKQQWIALGPSYSPLSYETARVNLQLYRATKKWEKPSASASSLRSKNSIAAMFLADSKGLAIFDPSTIQDPFLKRQLQLARFKLQRNLERHYTFKCDRVRIPSGETYVSAKGDVSLVAKLRDVEQWCVTEGCFEKAAWLLYSIPAFKRSARAHIGRVPRKVNDLLWAAFRDAPNPGFEIFKTLLMDVVTIVPGFRVSTVPKNNNADRVIGCEPFLNMLVQSVVEEGIRNVLKAQYSVDLSKAADLHKALISDPCNATIDLRNASNSTYLCFVKWFLQGTPLLADLLDSRSNFAVCEGTEHPLRMISPMGGGYTFGLMSMILLSIAREFDSFAHVYGDDIIVDVDVANPVIELYQIIGYATNTEKTFTSGFFRESCGAFASHSKYITSFEMEWPTDLIEAIVLTNKIGVLAQEDDSIWGQLHTTLLTLWDPSFLRWVPNVSYVVSRGRFNQLIVHTKNVIVYTTNAMKRKRQSKTTRLLWEHNASLATRFLKQIQYDQTQVQFCWEAEYVEKTYRRIPLDNVHHHWAGYYLFGGRCSTPVIRHNADRDGPRRVRLKPKLIPYWSHSSSETCNTPGKRWIGDLLAHIYC